jgi:hypothetical protein
MGQTFISLCMGNGSLALILIMSVAGSQTRCHSSSRNANVPPSVNTNGAGEIDNSKLNLELKLSADKTELRPGECSDLRLTVLNSSRSAQRWKKDWVFEQEGPTPPLPESFPRSDIELPAGVETNVLTIRLCHADLKPGLYRYRISAGPANSERPRSNQVSIEVVP